MFCLKRCFCGLLAWHHLLIRHCFGGIILNICTDIHELQERILYELEGRINHWTDKSVIGDIFVANAEGLKLYVTYINNYDNALITIRNMSKEYPKFKEFLKENQQREAGEAQDIHSLLITVVQRPPRYCLLLKELLKNTPESHKDRRPVASALAAVEKAAEYINGQKMIAEGHERALLIRKMFQNKYSYVSTTGARIVYEGSIKTVKKTKVYVVVFDNYFLIGEEKTGFLGKKKSKYDPIIWIPLEHVKLAPASDTSLTVAFENPNEEAKPSSSSSPASPAPAHRGSVGSGSPSSSSLKPEKAEKEKTHAKTPSGGSSSASSSSSGEPAPHLIHTVPNMVFVWENHEALQAWMAAVLEAQTKIKKPKDEGRARGSSIFSWLKW